MSNWKKSQTPGHHLHPPCTLIPIRLCIWRILSPNSTLSQLLKPLYFLFPLEMGSLAKQPTSSTPSQIVPVSVPLQLSQRSWFSPSNLPSAPSIFRPGHTAAMPFPLTANSKTLPTSSFSLKRCGSESHVRPLSAITLTVAVICQP